MANASRKCGPSFIFSLSRRLGSRGSASQHSPAVFYKILPASGDTYKTAELKFATSIPVDSRTTYKLDIEILSYFFLIFASWACMKTHVHLLVKISFFSLKQVIAKIMNSANKYIVLNIYQCALWNSKFSKKVQDISWLPNPVFFKNVYFFWKIWPFFNKVVHM